ncbi:protein DMP7-like [Primulina huaijiensis]|uniref:protein DMP7-like n=1 Tax=Primulina huaijiensis TaxID=1492673 RepID=UPI003CC6F2CD
MGSHGEETKTDEDLQLHLLEEQAAPSNPEKTPMQKAIRKAFKGTAHLANLLPTGSMMAFQVMSPVFTHEGKCKSFVSQTTTIALLSVCAISCFIMCFTDSFRDERGKVRYGVATFRGLWIMDGSARLPPEEAAKYRVSIADFIHAILSILVFGAVAMFDKNVVSCFYPTPSEEAVEILMTFPVIVGVICSLLFVLFPSKRHGIGFPLSRR